MSDEGKVFASIGPAGIVHYVKCWGCQLNQCPGGIHGWADIEDVKHALRRRVNSAASLAPVATTLKVGR